MQTLAREPVYLPVLGCALFLSFTHQRKNANAQQNEDRLIIDNIQSLNTIWLRLVIANKFYNTSTCMKDDINSKLYSKIRD